VDAHAQAIRLNDIGHEVIVSAIAGTRPADASVRQSLMEALEAAELAGSAHPKWLAESVIALVNLELFSLLVAEGSPVAYQKAIQDALDVLGKSFDGSSSTPLEITRLAHVWYSLGFHQQALTRFQEAVGLYQQASQTALAVPEADRDIRLLILIATNIATCAEKLGLAELAARTRNHVESLLRLLGNT
jgi:tetratricopeptide (TPR) repeat protein